MTLPGKDSWMGAVSHPPPEQKKGIRPAGHDAVPQGDVVASHQGQREVFGEVEDGQWSPVGVFGHAFKTEGILPKLLQHGRDVAAGVEVLLPRQFSNLLAGHREAGAGLGVEPAQTKTTGLEKLFNGTRYGSKKYPQAKPIR